MDENLILYRMNRLLRITEIDAYSARTNVGSRAEYCALLTTFIEASPTLAEGLSAALKIRNAELFQKTCFNLQKLLLSIGANNLLWEAEKTADLSRKKLWKECADRTVPFVLRIKRLSDQLRDACVKPGESVEADGDDSPADIHVIAIGQGAIASGRPRAPIEPERFEQIRPYLRHPVQAIERIRELMAFSYNHYVDALLASLHGCLSNGEWENAENQFESLMQSVREPQEQVDGGKKGKVLAVDDAPDILHAVNTILKDEYTVYCATNHMAALKVLANNHPDLVILDIEMPDMSGFDMVGMIRTIKAYENIPVFFLSANVTVENIVKSRKMGVGDFLKKPVNPEFLLSKVRHGISKVS